MFYQGEMEGNREGYTWQFSLEHTKILLLLGGFGFFKPSSSYPDQCSFQVYTVIKNPMQFLPKQEQNSKLVKLTRLLQK